MRKEYEKLLNCLILLIIVLIITFIIKYYFKPFIYILVLFFICKPFYNLFLKVGIKDKLSAALSLVVINLIMFSSLFYLGSEFYSLIQKNLIENIHKMDMFIENIVGSIFLNKSSFNNLQNNFSIIDNSILKKGAQYTSDGITSYIVATIAVYFLLIDWREFYNDASNIFPSSFFMDVSLTFKKMKKLIVIETILMFFSTIETLIGFLILRIPNAFIFSIFCGLLDILPYVGTIIVFIPLIIYNIILKEYFVVAGLIFLYILVQVNREILETKYIGEKLGIHPLIALISIYIGMKIFGLIGIIAGPFYILLSKNIVLNKTQEEK
ncbi:AI-2E family transporter [Clostridium polyendosporum]|uniref:AI-2E family transporter n=1 Tax=Clostridium polyendosporum TaxID=69208 RepID=A0A919VEW3_9CLOT|nr:AI-2E family transporter [Clostridium polyendosporum]GIM27810.1 AI-2E family transporter [Clostridium polyendosporum]